MGLDCIPHDYPCAIQGTAVRVVEQDAPHAHPLDGRIDCKATQAANGCPWLRATEGQDRGRPILGMFGTDCWYRGKAGSRMLLDLDEAGYDDMPGGPEAFYGEGHVGEVGEGEPDLTPEFCAELSAWMKDHVEAYASLHPGEKEQVDYYRYAAWWVGWVGEQCGGADAWY